VPVFGVDAGDDVLDDESDLPDEDGAGVLFSDDADDSDLSDLVDFSDFSELSLFADFSPEALSAFSAATCSFFA
jgi:hypothetical protein